ncbi:MAG: hypothetical protein SGPRY_006364 [Prymnesium sp.]
MLALLHARPGVSVGLRGAAPVVGARASPYHRMGLLEDGIQSTFNAVKSTVEGVQAAYDDESFVPEGFAKAHHILFLAGEDAERKADVVRARIEAGDFTFFEAAKSFSACPTRDLQGDLGTFTSLSRLGEGTLRGDRLPYEGEDTKPFDDLVFAQDTSLHTIHKVHTQWGVHLVLVTARGGQTDIVGEAAKVVKTVMEARPPEVADPAGETRNKGFGLGSERKAGGRNKKKKKK